MKHWCSPLWRPPPSSPTTRAVPGGDADSTGGVLRAGGVPLGGASAFRLQGYRFVKLMQQPAGHADTATARGAGHGDPAADGPTEWTCFRRSHPRFTLVYAHENYSFDVSVLAVAQASGRSPKLAQDLSSADPNANIPVIIQYVQQPGDKDNQKALNLGGQLKQNCTTSKVPLTPSRRPR